MRILVIGSGGREHALCWKLSQSLIRPEIHAAPGNPGIAQLATCHLVPVDDIQGQVELAIDLKAELVIVGPENPLANGLADLLEKTNIPVFGPSAKAAQLESSKIFAKKTMLEADVPFPYAMPIDGDVEAARLYLKNRKFPIVIKVDGLASGKGVSICHNLDKSYQVIEDLMVKKTLGQTGETILIEDYLIGVECSILAICGGLDFIYFPAIQDYKPIGAKDTGPNTGGMGAVTPIASCNWKLVDTIAEHIIKPVLNEMYDQNTFFRGCLYAGLMLTNKGPQVLEFNVRFGDLETQVAMAMLDEDLLELLIDVAHDFRFETRRAKWKSGACACVVAASDGYGYTNDYEKGKVITGLDKAVSNGSFLFQAGTALENDNLITNGGRVLSVTSTEKSIKLALQKAYQSLDQIHFDGIYYRPDIGCNAI